LFTNSIIRIRIPQYPIAEEKTIKETKAVQTKQNSVKKYKKKRTSKYPTLEYLLNDALETTAKRIVIIAAKKPSIVNEKPEIILAKS